ncbi:MAG: CstA-like transporter-associated (seleno)protein [Gemmatimonadales bacterium]
MAETWRWSVLRANLRRILGMPDYQRYVAELRREDPDREVPSEAEHFEAYLAARYGQPPIRCC